MADSNAGADKQPEMIQPTPVFDITHQHVYTGQVFKQLYIFFYIGVAFLVGAILPWEGEGGSQMPNLFQGFMIIAGVACTVAGWIGIKGRHAAVTPFMLTEILALMLVILTYAQVTAGKGDYKTNPEFAAIEAEMANYTSDQTEWQELNERREMILNPWGFKDLTLGQITTFTKKSDDPARQRALVAASSFGTGFFITALTSLFLFFFMAFSIFGASKAGKAKKAAEAEAMAERRKSGRAKSRSGADADSKGETGDEVKTA